MSYKKTNAAFWGNSLNTLAQNETGNTAIIIGNGSELGNDKTIKSKAKRKLITQVMNIHLLRVAEKREDTERKKSFWNTFHCQSRIYSTDGRTYGNYCKNRHCLLCCAIRKADIINRYLPTLQTWEEPHFLTLTVKAVRKNSLNKVMNGMIEAFKKITALNRKRNLRGKGVKLIGIKSLECNFNPIRKTYNPHFHVIVPDKQIAEILVKEWLNLWTPQWTTRKAQYYRKVENLEAALIETIKYGSKIFTEPDVLKKSISNVDRKIYATALYNIFEAMSGLRIFDRFGFNLPKDAKRKSTSARIVIDFAEWKFDWRYFDWLNSSNELNLSAYQPTNTLINLLRYEVDEEIQ